MKIIFLFLMLFNINFSQGAIDYDSISESYKNDLHLSKPEFKIFQSRHSRRFRNYKEYKEFYNEDTEEDYNEFLKILNHPEYKKSINELETFGIYKNKWMIGTFDTYNPLDKFIMEFDIASPIGK